MGSQTERRDRKRQSYLLMIYAAIFAAITFAVFTFLSIPIPTPGGGKVSVHLGNAFCVLGALVLGTGYGSVGGALGMTIADLADPIYIVQAPITFLIKLAMGVITGCIAHRAGRITHQTETRHVLRWAVLASAAGLIFNGICDPVIRYFYKILILGKPAAEVSFAINIGVAAINSVVSLLVAVNLYMAVRTALKKMNAFFYF